MSWQPFDRVREAVNVFLDYYTSASLEDAVWSRRVEFGLPSGTKVNHDGAMIHKISRLQDDHPMLPQISKILSNLPVEQYNAVLAFYFYTGLNTEAADQKWKDGRAFTDADRAKKVGQTESQFKKNYGAARAIIYKNLTEKQK